MKHILIFTLLVLLSCVTENQTYLVSCPVSNMSLMRSYQTTVVKQGFIKKQETLYLLYEESLLPVSVLNGCVWVHASDELLDAPPVVIEAFGENIWWVKSVFDGERN